jgi:hypothetical protein
VTGEKNDRAKPRPVLSGKANGLKATAGKRAALDDGADSRATQRKNESVLRSQGKDSDDFLDRLRALKGGREIGTIGSVLDGREAQRYEAMGDHERADRERAAVSSAKNKAKRVAPLYNKGPVQYIGDSDDLTGVGRKK